MNFRPGPGIYDTLLDQTLANLLSRYPELRTAFNSPFWPFVLASTSVGKEDSDIDLAIVFKNLSDLFDMQGTLMKLRRQFDTRIEPHPLSESDFQISNPLANEILKTGIRII